MAVYLRDEVWYIRLSIKKKRYHRAIPEASNKKEAEKAEAIFKAELLQGKYNLADNKGEMLFKKLVEEYNNYAMSNKLSWKRDLSRVNSLLDYFGNKKLRDITPIVIERYRIERKKHLKKNGKPLTAASINRETSILRKMFSIAVENDWINDNPCLARKVKPFREDSKRERFLEPDEEIKLLSLCVGQLEYLKPILICALHTGMRRGEILNLKWDYIDLKQGFITVTKTKSGIDRNIPISNTLKNVLMKLYLQRKNEHVFVNPVTEKPYFNIDKGFKAILEKAGIIGLVFHDLRHTAATRMVASGIDIIVVKDILGHSDLRTTQRYSHPVPERKLQAIKELDEFCRKNNKELVHLSV